MAKKNPETKAAYKARLAFLLPVAAVLLVAGSATAYAFSYSHRILPHTVVAGVGVGGLTQEAASARLAGKEKAFVNRPVRLSYQDKTWDLKPADLGVSFENQAAVQQAYAYGKNGGFIREVGELARALVGRRYLEVSMLSLTDKGRQQLHETVLKSIEDPPQETSLDFSPGRVTVKNGKAGKKIDGNVFEADLYRSFKSEDSHIALQLAEFQPEVSPAQAESERVYADRLLAGPWQLTMADQSYAVQPSDIAGWLSTEVTRDATGKAQGLQVVVNRDALKKWLEPIAGKAAKQPVNALIRGENGAISLTKDGQDGLKVDQDKTAEAMATGLTDHANLAKSQPDRNLVAVTATVAPDLTAASIAQLGIKELIGTATTDFSGSPNNRMFNIGLGQRSLNGGVVKDGETYSTTGSLGPVDESTGYLPELVIINNRTTPEAGGGLCQVSTTLFRAVLNAGLPVVERTNHAYRVGYYERGVGPGLDATVYIPNPDFKWKNDTGHAVYIQSYIKGTTITFELYGTKDGRASTISAPQILEETPPGDPIYSDTDTLFKGETKQVETPHGGAKTLVTYTVTRDGQQINHQDFRSTYRPWPAQYLVGTKERPQ